MRIKILMRFAKKVLTAILAIVVLITYGVAIILFSRWIARMLPSDSAAWISLGVVVVVGTSLWLVEQYQESRQEVERDQRYQEGVERFEQQRERVEQRLEEAQEGMTT